MGIQRRCGMAVLGAAVFSVLSLPATGQQHPVPADKGLSPDWLAALTQRGTPERWSGNALATIGMPVGGIATGQLYLRGDGTTALWQIFNQHVFSGTGAECYRGGRPEAPVAQGLGLLIEKDGRETFRRLAADGFREVGFTGEYPIAVVDYADPECPVAARLDAFSPFLPLNARDSALPATIFVVHLENRGDAPVRLRLLAWLENAVCRHSANDVPALGRSVLAEEEGWSVLEHTAEEWPRTDRAERRPPIVVADFEGGTYGDWRAAGTAFGERPAAGTLPEQQAVEGFLGRGLVNTFLDRDLSTGRLVSPEFTLQRYGLRFLIGGGAFAGKTCIHLVQDGKPVRTATGRNRETLEWHVWDVRDLEGQPVQLEIVDDATGGWGHINIDQIEMTDDTAHGPPKPLDQLADFGTLALGVEGPVAPLSGSRLALTLGGVPLPAAPESRSETYALSAGAVATLGTPYLELRPGESLRRCVVLGWCFPNHPRGREYANRFDSARAVVAYVRRNRQRLESQTRLWQRTFYEDSTLPRWLLLRLHAPVANLATDTCQWWGNGRFWAWEGVGCCAGTCTHVWNYEHAMAHLFPELERTVREMQDFGEGFDAATGLVGFRGNRAYAADGQCGTVLKAYREHTRSADDAFLRRNWESIRKALLYVIGHDGKDDGMIEDSQHNTFDINFVGPNTFVGSLYLAALRAGEEMARDMQDAEFAQRCRSIFEKGRQRSVEELWNGEYFVQKVDLAQHPKHQYGEGCLSDQLFGQGWAHLLGLGYLYPPEQVRTALESVWRYNWAPDVAAYNTRHPPQRRFASPGEAGLFTCTWPRSPYLAEGVLYRNEVWTGIEYQVAGHMAWEEMVTQALAICRGVHERYQPAKHNPYNEVECGDHYARALASWGVYLGLCGCHYHGPKGTLAFAPRLEGDFRAAFTAAEGWGLFRREQEAGVTTARLELRWGSLRLTSFEIAHGAGREVRATAARNAEPLPCRVETDADRARLTFAQPLQLQAGETLTVVMAP
ncbi:MAG: hypothetical protein JXR77_05075 [Lentisphaeria bacterium]|nr:hypothetical protein [Lentisphaeria bacterium]